MSTDTRSGYKLNRLISVAVFASFVGGNSLAVGQLLTGKDAARIVELLPDIEAARKRGACPDLEAVPWGPTQFAIQVRDACTGQLIGSFWVDRQTGKVTAGETSPTVMTPAMRAEARDLVAAACRRLLSPEEARCLAIQAAKDSIGIQRDNGGLSVDTLEGGRPGEAHFIVTYHLRGQPAVSARSFIVDLESWQLWDAHTFTPFRSEGVGRLASMMASARSEPALSPEDILQIALRTPRVTSRLSTGCSGLVVGGEGTSAATYVGLRGCPGSFGTSETSVAVDTHTGVVTDPRTGKQVDAPDATRLAADLVREQTRRHLEVVEGLKAACPVN